jgi:hypothetical protein
MRRVLRSPGVPFAEWTSEGQQMLQYRVPDDQPNSCAVLNWVYDEDGMTLGVNVPDDQSWPQECDLS